MKSVLLHVNDDAGQESRLLAALAISRQHGARLTCIQVTPVSDYVVTDPFGGMHQVAMLFEHLAAQAVEARTRLEARLSSEQVAWDWSVHDGGVAATIINRSLFADLIVLSQEGHTERAAARSLPLVADVAIHARTPVLAVPVDGQAFDPGGIAVIAWNGAPEAAHAVRAALPMLRRASAVHIITLAEDTDVPVDGIRRYLEDHGITAGCSPHSLNEKNSRRSALPSCRSASCRLCRDGCLWSLAFPRGGSWRGVAPYAGTKYCPAVVGTLTST